ncbi:hypothetical protein TOC8171_50730 [Pseudomonas syringae]
MDAARLARRACRVIAILDPERRMRGMQTFDKPLNYCRQNERPDTPDAGVRFYMTDRLDD